jgi:hypothetical protein
MEDYVKKIKKLMKMKKAFHLTFFKDVVANFSFIKNPSIPNFKKELSIDPNFDEVTVSKQEIKIKQNYQNDGDPYSKSSCSSIDNIESVKEI